MSQYSVLGLGLFSFILGPVVGFKGRRLICGWIESPSLEIHTRSTVPEFRLAKGSA